MGLHRITIEGYTYEEAALIAGREALSAARVNGINVTKAEVVVHPGQDDEKTTDLLAEPVPAPAEASERGPDVQAP